MKHHYKIVRLGFEEYDSIMATRSIWIPTVQVTAESWECYCMGQYCDRSTICTIIIAIKATIIINGLGEFMPMFVGCTMYTLSRKSAQNIPHT